MNSLLVVGDTYNTVIGSLVTLTHKEYEANDMIIFRGEISIDGTILVARYFDNGYCFICDNEILELLGIIDICLLDIVLDEEEIVNAYDKLANNDVVSQDEIISGSIIDAPIDTYVVNEKTEEKTEDKTEEKAEEKTESVETEKSLTINNRVLNKLEELFNQYHKLSLASPDNATLLSNCLDVSYAMAKWINK